MNTIAKDKTFAASLAVVTVAILASQGIELEGTETLQAAFESICTAFAFCGAAVAGIRVAILKRRSS